MIMLPRVYKNVDIKDYLKRMQEGGSINNSELTVNGLPVKDFNTFPLMTDQNIPINTLPIEIKPTNEWLLKDAKNQAVDWYKNRRFPLTGDTYKEKYFDGIKLKETPKDDFYGGSYNPITNTIESKLKNQTPLNMVHELRHALQDRKGSLFNPTGYTKEERKILEEAYPENSLSLYNKTAGLPKFISKYLSKFESAATNTELAYFLDRLYGEETMNKFYNGTLDKKTTDYIKSAIVKRDLLGSYLEDYYDEFMRKNMKGYDPNINPFDLPEEEFERYIEEERKAKEKLYNARLKALKEVTFTNPTNTLINQYTALGGPVQHFQKGGRSFGKKQKGSKIPLNMPYVFSEETPEGYYPTVKNDEGMYSPLVELPIINIQANPTPYSQGWYAQRPNQYNPYLPLEQQSKDAQANYIAQNTRKATANAAPYIGATIGAPLAAIGAGYALSALPYFAPGTTLGTIAAEAAIGTMGSRLIDNTLKATTGKTWGENVSDIVSKIPGTQYSPQWLKETGNLIADISNPGWYVGAPLETTNRIFTKKLINNIFSDIYKKRL